MVFVLGRTVFTVFRNIADPMQIMTIPSLVACYVFFRCEIEKESLSWVFPQHSLTPPHTHTIFYRHIFFLACKHNSRTHISDLWVDYILKDIAYPSCLTWFHSGGGTKLSFSWKPSLENSASKCSGFSIIQAFDGLEWSCEYQASMYKPVPCTVPYLHYIYKSVETLAFTHTHTHKL